MVAEQPQDFLALQIVFFLADRFGAESLVREIAAHQKLDIFCWYVCKPEIKEGLFGLEITDLQNTRDLSVQAVPLLREGEFLRRKREILRALEVVEVG